MNKSHSSRKNQILFIASFLIILVINLLIAQDKSTISINDINRIYFKQSAFHLTPLEIRSYGKVRESGGVQRPVFGFQWNEADQESLEWYPQGITGVESNKNIILVSWYNRENAKSRVSIVDMSQPNDIVYLHADLVQMKKNGKLMTVMSHAGGLAEFNHNLYVADDEGILIFDLNNIFVSKDKGVSIPLKKSYTRDEMDKNKVPPISFLSIDRTEINDPKLLVGNYYSKHRPEHKKILPSLVWISINNQGDIILTDTIVRKITKNLKPRIQGAVYENGKLWLSTSGKRARIHVKNIYEKSSKWKSHSWAYGTEDIFLSKDDGLIWGLTEHPPNAIDKKGNRFVFAVNLSDYLP